MRSILVIESNPELRRFVTALLARSGHRALAAANVPEAAALLASARVEVVVTDLAFADRAPREALSAFRQESPELEIVPLSDAAQSSGYLRLAAALGAARTLAQPFMSEQLVALTHRDGGPESGRAETSHRTVHRGFSSRERGPA